MKSGFIWFVTCLLALPLVACTDDRVDRDEQRSDHVADEDLANGHNTKCTNNSPQPCPCNTSADCPAGFYCQAADSTPLYGYCIVKPMCNAGDPNCPPPNPGCNAGDPNCN